ncbi:MAG TPA: hypothetical protein VJS14_16005 [Enterobacteriaceae bacterium]|nr:hypothetical protein [Enterobacteriaceae bacterium]
MANATSARWLLWLGIGLLGGCAQPQAPLTGKALEQAAAQGDVHAQYILARQLAERHEYPRAMQLMQTVGNKGAISSATAWERSEAARQVGDWYQAGLGEPRNEPLAITWWEKASSLGNARASYQLALRCQQQHGGEVTTDCIDVWEKAGEQGHGGAQLALATWFARHEGASQKALSWLQKAADQQQPEALYLLAQRYEKGDGVDKREDMAERLYLQSAEKGYPAAQRRQGERREGKVAFDWYLKAAEGNDPAAQRWMAVALLEGKGAPRNEPQGMAWLQRAVKGGDPQAQYLYSQRQTREEDRERYLELSAKGDYSDAQHALAGIYIGRGEETRARKLWASLAQKGDPQDRYAYAEMLRLGQGGKEEFAEAFKQYRLAAMQGNRQAQYRMGMMRQEGMGATRNRIHAYAWYSLATTKGMREALAALNDLEATMKPEEIESAQKLAMLWGKQIAKRNGEERL